MATRAAMQGMWYRALGVLLVTASLLGCEYLPVSSGELQGTVADIPSRWSDVEIPDIIQLESNPEQPYSVNLWTVVVDNSLYVFAGDNRAVWVDNIAANPNVRMAMDGTIYELYATQVSDAEEFVLFADQWEIKYGNRPRNENVDETFLYRLKPRTQ